MDRFPWQSQRPRKIRGQAVREVRVGMPVRGVTRLVIEFQPDTQLDAKALSLVGVDWDSWRLRFRRRSPILSHG